MNYFKVKTFFQIEYYKGWADKGPKADTINGPKFYIKADKTHKDLYSYIYKKIEPYTSISFRLEDAKENSLAIPEEEFIENLLKLKLAVISQPDSEKKVCNDKASATIQDSRDKANTANTVYVTNATADSVAYNVCLFLNYENKEKEIVPQKEQIEKFLDLFKNQAKEFIEIYAKLRLHLDDFIDSLSQEERFKLFRVKTKAKVKEHFRHIYHSTPECDYLLSDYDEGDTHYANTLVFDGYKLDKNFLDELGFRGCYKCCPEMGNTESKYHYTTVTSTREEWL